MAFITMRRAQPSVAWTIRFLDGVFVCACAAMPLAMLGIGARAGLVSNKHGLIVLTAALAAIGAIGAVAILLWAMAHAGPPPASRVRHLSWADIVRRYPVLIGPAAYYVGAYRPTGTGRGSWVDALMRRRRVLDAVADGAWWGTLGASCLPLGVVLAALLQSSTLFMLVAVVFVLLVASTGAAFCLLAVVVLIHVVTAPPSGSRAASRLDDVLPIGTLWVRGFRQYYHTAMRPSLVASEGHER